MRIDTDDVDNTEYMTMIHNDIVIIILTFSIGTPNDYKALRLTNKRFRTIIDKDEIIIPSITRIINPKRNYDYYLDLNHRVQLAFLRSDIALTHCEKHQYCENRNLLPFLLKEVTRTIEEVRTEEYIHLSLKIYNYLKLLRTKYRHLYLSKRWFSLFSILCLTPEQWETEFTFGIYYQYIQCSLKFFVSDSSGSVIVKHNSKEIIRPVTKDVEDTDIFLLFSIRSHRINKIFFQTKPMTFLRSPKTK